MKHVVFIVLGDCGRSPRMQYHVRSTAALPWVNRVTFVGYEGENCIDELRRDKKIFQSRFSIGDFKFLRKISILHALFKGIHLLLALILVLWNLPRFEVIVIQNPPCLPAVIVAFIIRGFNGCTIIIDWHNLGFKMFEERLGSSHILVRVSAFLEKWCSKWVDAHLCVSSAMKDWLICNFGVKAIVVYDRPAGIFHREGTDLVNRHKLLSKLQFDDRTLFPDLMKDSNVPNSQTIQTEDINGVIQKRDDQATLLISSTSWSPDEDFSILLNALLYLETAYLNYAQSRNTEMLHGLPRRLLVAVTGKGPLKAAFEGQVKSLEEQGKLRFIKIRTVWLEPGDYPLLMGCADLGVCLHTSTSGLDLPMKVLDMFGSGVPVCAVGFPALPELVRAGENGLIFHSPVELFQQLVKLLLPEAEEESCGASVSGKETVEVSSQSSSRSQQSLGDDEHNADRDVGAEPLLKRLQSGAASIGTWQDNWSQTVEPLLCQMVQAKPKSTLFFWFAYVALGSIALATAVLWIRSRIRSFG